MGNEEVVVNDKFTQERTYVLKDKAMDCDMYSVARKSDDVIIGIVQFQHGPVKEAGEVNGLFNEDLLLMIIDRLETYQKGKFACAENEEAIKHLYSAVTALRARTERRRVEGTLGTHRV